MKPGKNASCPCGSGKKYEKCCFDNAANVLPARELLLKAVALHQAGRLDEAEAYYQLLLQNDPGDSDALHYLGLIAFQKGDYSGAANLIEQAIKLDGSIPAFHFNLGNAYKQLKRPGLAIDAYLEAIRLDPAFLKAHLNLGNTLRDKGDLDAAIGSYHHALSLKPDYAEAHNNMGLALQAQGKLDAAIGSYHHACALKPDYAEACNNLGVAQQALGNLDAAIGSYRHTLSLKPGYAEAHFNLGVALQAQGKFDAAIGSYRHALSLKPDYADARFNLGFVLEESGRADDAVDCYRQVLSLKPDHADAHYNLGLLLQELGRADDAIACYRQALLHKPDFADTYYALHAPLLNPADMAPSIECMQKAVELDPDNANFRFFLGMLLDYSGNPDAAASHFEIVEKCSDLYRARLDGWRYIKSAGSRLPPITGYPIQAFKLGMDAARSDGLVLEFGVRFGTSIRQIATLVQQEVHGFDSFEGLPEDWHSEPKGSYSTKGLIPVVPENVTLHAGWFENTLPKFLNEYCGPVRFMNIDCDIYSSTRTVLELLAERISPGTVIVFDEYIGHEHWREDEFKAFREAVAKFGWNYEYLCFSCITKQVVVRITQAG